MTRSVDPSAVEAPVLLQVADEVTTKVVRAWMLRMLRWGAGSSNADLLLGLLDGIGLRHSRRFIEQQGEWLASRGYLAISLFEMVTVYRLTRAGDEAARGVVTDEGVSRIALADVIADELVIKSVRSNEVPARQAAVPTERGSERQ